MELLRRAREILARTEKERENLLSAVAAYRKAKKRIQKRKGLIIMCRSTEEASVDKNFVPLSLEEKRATVLQLNKRLAQLNNTKEKAKTVAEVVANSVSQTIAPEKITAFLHLLIQRVIAQSQVQIASNPESAAGYAHFLVFLSSVYPSLEQIYRSILFTSVLPLECLCGMYRVYFHMLRILGKSKEAWTFISDLLNQTEDLSETFNPSVVVVFLEVMNEQMLQVFSGHWISLLECIRAEYVEAVKDVFPREAHNISRLASREAGM